MESSIFGGLLYTLGNGFLQILEQLCFDFHANIIHELENSGIIQLLKGIQPRNSEGNYLASQL
jgi:hypothetical protein